MKPCVPGLCWVLAAAMLGAELGARPSCLPGHPAGNTVLGTAPAASRAGLRSLHILQPTSRTRISHRNVACDRGQPEFRQPECLACTCTLTWTGTGSDNGLCRGGIVAWRLRRSGPVIVESDFLIMGRGRDCREGGGA
ncbi:hypothetical protein CALCODRAFT_303800 [Calocera cornea HHB12733]|uniref:Cyanovirin-N domain-containing protein n=1 Tax=Calocera cornea HHB12733 TaxID=1353952 RepID=A0A165JKF8_9BASI|nr:hypothetical protein CALCODRAFT_303800 [Calocera cornea HHB12733]